MPRAASEPFSWHFDAERKVFAANGQIGIVNGALDPNSRAMDSVIKKFCAE